MDRSCIGSYFDGKSSRAYPCKVVLGEDNLTIYVLAAREVAPQEEHPDDGEVLPDTSQQEVHPVPGEYSAPDLDILFTKIWDFSGIKIRDTRPHHGELQYGPFPHETLIIQDPQFLSTLQNTRYFKRHRFFYEGFFGSPRKVVGSVFLTIALIVGFYFMGIPLIADLTSSLLPPSQESSLGETLFSNIVESEGGLTRPELQEKVLEFARTLTFGHQIKEIALLPGDTINAFAVMGGYIGIYLPMLELIETPDELAALLAHEWAHIEKRHSTRLIVRNLAGYYLISLIAGDFSGFLGILIENGHMLNNLRYSRTFEEEADLRAKELLIQNGFSPEGLTHLLTKISEKESEKGPEWLSTHPSLFKRLHEERVSSLPSTISSSPQQERIRQQAALLFEQIKMALQ
ncbi:MAG TPA: M48 family metallopeptidase [Termitinemataceae bacterium]|nr:M48 family metallopeptidase [Termitinemataceae bacterium]HOM23964.1 M48 family metallopeptidase [Termitinemataceae bacterium]HPQ01013.1 M48 family metallopeptidase [Termitinemataceae bacterium]